ncbi:Protein ERD1, putative [Perkinsus marinus ATCC 50983]|uniref:Protein ERD1, putative n=1 Tax=Perkinsus marinus (strain ATCC 50983 / TXsc) TaxID=423536 RepID=C5LYS1_PERM5|nr:Protein ERD1, putative [Perkinsus marinus ATCC 50983]EEQ98095.1 Protein ERD1, putative [Perkinsus marinus ATCC 50983]|eukprot:XP_002765378.1 Protein ERD1, putative [Perkinsus marinus ATCC 50983]
MKFEKQLRRYAIAEWADNYIDYRRLKKALARSVHRSRRVSSAHAPSPSLEDMMRRSREYSMGAVPGLPPQPHQILGISPSSFVNSETSLDEWYQLLELQIRKVNIFFELQYHDLESQVIETEKLVHSIESSSSSESSIGITTDPQYYHPAHPGQSPVYAQEEQNNNHNGRQIEYPYTPYEEGNLQAPLIRERRHRSPEETRNAQMMMRAENTIANLTERIDLLRSYSRLNHLAVAKILKKHDKVTRIGLSQVLMPEVSSQPFYDLGRLDALDSRLKHLLPCTNPSEADQQFLKRLRYFREHMGGGHSKVLRGFYIGVSVMLMIDLVVLICIPHTNPNFDEEAFFASLTTFRFVFMSSLALWSAGWAMSILETYSVNYLFLLDCDPNIEVRSDTLFNIAALHTSLFILFFGLYVVDYKFAIFGYHGYYVVYPAVLLFFWLVSMLWPHDIFRLRYRKGIVMSLWRTVKAPFGGSVTFADNITGDVLTSAVKPLQVIVYQWRLYLGRSLSIQDLAIAFFFFSSPMDIARSKTENHPILIPLIAFLPYWFRMMQCLNRWWETGETRHLWNFGKYSCGNIMVVVTALPLSDFPFFSVYTERLVWVFVYCLSSMYMYCWDVGMDWGIVSFSTTDHTGNITIIM